jgi:hypothetical protein
MNYSQNRLYLPRKCNCCNSCVHIFVHEFISKGSRLGYGLYSVCLNQLWGRFVVTVARKVGRALLCDYCILLRVAFALEN